MSNNDALTRDYSRVGVSVEYEPSRRRIKAECAAIQAAWSDAEWLDAMNGRPFPCDRQAWTIGMRGRS